VFDWPSDGRLRVPLVSEVQRAYLLANRSKALTVQAAAEGQLVHLPEASPTPHAGVVVLEIQGQPQVLESRVGQATDGTLTLKAADADLIGQTIQLETKAGKVPNIGFWTDTRDHVKWPVTITQPGWFEIEAEYACDPGSAGSDCVLTIGDEQVTATVEATGDWADFVTETVGQIQIKQKGSLDVVLKATRKPGLGVVNLRSIVLRPY